MLHFRRRPRHRHHHHHHHRHDVVLSYDESIASSKASSPQSAIWCFHFQLPAPSRFRTVIQELLTSSSTFSRPLYLSFNNVLEDSSVARYEPSFVWWYVECFFPPNIMYSSFLHDRSNWTLLSSDTTFKTFSVYHIYFPKLPSFSTLNSYAPNTTFQ